MAVGARNNGGPNDGAVKLSFSFRTPALWMAPNGRPLSRPPKETLKRAGLKGPAIGFPAASLGRPALLAGKVEGNKRSRKKCQAGFAIPFPSIPSVGLKVMRV